MLISICLTFCFFSVYNLFSQDSGGFTDPKTPGRHSRLNIDSANIVVKPHGIYAEITTEFWYRSLELNASTDTLEMYDWFNLPATDFVNDSWLWVNDTLVHAMIIDVNTASLIYEDIVHRLHKDPSILYRRSTTGRYEYRIFPNVGDQSRHAKLSYYTKMTFTNGNAQFTFQPTILNISVNKSFPRNFKFYLNDNFTDIDFGSNPPVKSYSNDYYGKYLTFNTVSTSLNQTFSYQYDFSKPYFSISNRIDGQEYYFTMFDSKLLISNYVNQKINFLIDYDLNKTSISAKNLIDQLKSVILSNFNDKDSINIMIGNRNPVNLFNRWVPCNKDTINLLIDSTLYNQIGYYSYLWDLLYDGITFNANYQGNSSIVLLTSSEYAPTPTTANPLIEYCLQQMGGNSYKITSIDFSDIHYSKYTIGSKDYYGDQYFNEKIAELTKSDSYTIKGTNNTISGMLNTAFSILKGTISEIGLYVDPKDGISIAKTTENIIDNNSSKKLIYEYGKIEGDYPIEVKLSALLDGIPVMKKFIIDDTNVVKNNESAKFWNWKYLRILEDKPNKTTKENNDLVNRSITNRILTMQTAFLCLEPWMMPKDTSDVIPVELVEFSGEVRKNGITLFWATASEINNYGFYIERRISGSGRNWDNIGFVKGAGNSKSMIYYCYTDSSVKNRTTYDYRLRQVDVDGTQSEGSTSNIITLTYDLDFKSSLEQNSPNPFSSVTKISFSVQEKMNVKIDILDLYGNIVTTLIDKALDAQGYSVYWDGKNSNNISVLDGIYFCRMIAGNDVKILKMVLIK